jgi:hypothetical protein
MATGRIPTTANSPLTVKGDLFGYSTTQARVPVGNDGETLVADSSTSTGLRYSPANAVGNPVINSAFQVWQRGTSISVAGAADAYTADRWRLFTQSGQACTVSRQATNDTTNLPNIQYCARVQRNSGQTGTGQISFIQGMETLNSIPYAGKTVTVSFYARAGANYSATSNAFSFLLYSGTGTDQFPTSYTGGASVATTTVTLTTTWQRFTVTGTVATTATELGLYPYFSATGTAGANDYFEITGVQLDLGSVALPFRTYSATIQGELAACQRYYQRLEAANNSAQMAIGPAWAFSTGGADMVYKLTTEMRIAPTTLDYSSLSHFQWQGITTNSVPTSIVYDTNINSRYNAGVTFNKTSGYTSGGNYFILVNSSSAYIGFGAEL